MEMIEHEKDIAIKFDESKVMLQLLPWSALTEVGKCLTHGAEKYNAHNWRNGFPWSRLLGSTLRHIFAWARGQDLDPESGLNHMAHAATNCLFLLEHIIEGYGNDDRYKSNRTIT